MRVDFSDWHTSDGLVARKYTYSQMGNTRDTELEVHFDIQAGLAVHTFISFKISDLDLNHETSLRGALLPIDGSGPSVVVNMVGRPDSQGGCVMSIFGRDDQSRCLRAYLDGKNMHFKVETTRGEPLIKLPLPNDDSFQSVYRTAYDEVRAADAAQLEGADSVIGRLSRFLRGLSNQTDDERPPESPVNLPEATTIFPVARWNALVRYDPEIASAAAQLHPYGDKWVEILGRDFFALKEERSYLPHMIRRLVNEAQREKDQEAKREAEQQQDRRRSRFRKLHNNDHCSDASFDVLNRAESKGYILSVEESGTITATLPGRGTSYLRSNSDIQSFGQYI